jgi:predicted metal-dependent hydrolase
MPEPEDPRYLDGIACFNRGDYFDAHEVWEELWNDCPAADRRFYQALIQAAVALYHFERGNPAGTARLFRSGKRYMEPYHTTHRGLDIVAFWEQVESHVRPALGGASTPGPMPVIAIRVE